MYIKEKIALIESDDDQWSSYSVFNDEKKRLLSDYTEKQIDKMLEGKKIADIDVFKMYTSEVLSFKKKPNQKK